MLNKTIATRHLSWLAVLVVGAGMAMVGSSCTAVVTDPDGAPAAVAAYHRALAAGDSAAAVDLLAADVLIQEGGVAETLEEYLGHHLGADMEFAAAVPAERTVLRTEVNGDVAWVASSSKMVGSFRGREIRSLGAELMVLTKASGAWKIRAIHWSNR